MTKMRRDVLRRKVARGEMEARCTHSLTDDYAFDNANGFGVTGWMPAALMPEDSYKGAIEGTMSFIPFDFRTSTGCAWVEDGGTVVLSVHSNCSYELREVTA